MMEYNKLIAEMSLSDEVEGFYVLKAAYPKTTGDSQRQAVFERLSVGSIRLHRNKSMGLFWPHLLCR